MANILFYVPNLIGYARIILGALAFIYFNNPCYFFIFYSLSYLLDATDGYFARLLKQSTKFGAMLDMLTDRACTIMFLIMLSHLYLQFKAYFLCMALLDMISHWMQMSSTSFIGEESHKGRNKDEIFLVKIYYKSQVALFLIVFGAEAYSISLYLYHFYPELFRIAVMKYMLILFTGVFHFKQVISVAQLIGSVNRYVVKENEMIKSTVDKDKKQ